MKSAWRIVADRLSGRATNERFAAVERLVRKVGDAHTERAAELQAQLTQLTKSVAQPAAGYDLRDLHRSLRKMTIKLAKPEDPFFTRSRVQILQALDEIASNSEPILIGPWTGEVGFELLYWIPFLRWARARFDLAPHREIVVSRGGVAAWYGVRPEQYTDVFTVLTVDDFRNGTEDTTLKQRSVRALDRRIAAAVTERHALKEVRNVLHPRMMYRAFRHYWDDDAGYARINDFTNYSLVDPPDIEGPPGLPAEYVAVRFYFRRSFPDTPENRAFAHRVVTTLAERMPVIVVTSGVRVDDHRDWFPDDHPGVMVAKVPSVENNLAVQSAIIGGARAFVGTYGGYSYLAPFCRIPTIAFYSQRAFDSKHLYAATRAFERSGAAPLTLIDTSQVGLVQSALGALTSTSS